MTGTRLEHFIYYGKHVCFCNPLERILKNSFCIKRSFSGLCTATGLALLACALPALAQTTPSPTDKSATKPPAAMPMQPMPSKGPDSGMARMSGMGDMRGSMMATMKNMDSMKMTGDTDRDFASMMKMHHQSAVEMAEMELKKGKDAKMRSMAKRIISAQQKEIKEFDQWLGKQK